LNVLEFLQKFERAFVERYRVKGGWKISDWVKCEGNELPFAYDFDESGLKNVLGGKVPFTPLEKALPEMIERFEIMVKEGKVKEDDLWN